MDHGPLVVPPGQPAGGLEDPFLPHALRSRVIDDPVVELGDGLVELDDDQVLVVARFRDDRPAVAVTRHVLDTVDVRRHQQLVPVGRIVELRLARRPAPVDRVEVVARRPEVDGRIGVRLLQSERRVVERDVVVDELPDEREPREQARAGVEVVVVRDRLVLDHRLRQAVQQVVARREGRKPLEHRPRTGPRPAGPCSSGTCPRSATPCRPPVGFGGVRGGGHPADHRAGRQAGRPGEEPAAGEATVVPARPEPGDRQRSLLLSPRALNRLAFYSPAWRGAQTRAEPGLRPRGSASGSRVLVSGSSDRLVVGNLTSLRVRSAVR